VAITAATLRQIDKQLRELTTMYSGHTRTLAEAWDGSWKQLRPGLERALAGAAGGGLTPAQMMRDGRVVRELQAVFQSLETLAGNAAVDVSSGALPVIRKSLEDTQAMLRTMLPPSYPPPNTLVGVEALRAMEARVVQNVTKGFAQLPPRTMLAIRSNLLTGVVAGENPRVTARRMTKQAEDGYNLGLARAMNIARTEMLDAHRAGQQAQEKTMPEVVVGWTWVAHLGPRTCRSCIAMHGQEFEVDDPGPIDHQQGRCARVPRTPTWRELGLNVPEPPSRLPDKNAFFDGLSEDQQRSILGRKGYDEWRAGRFPMDQWTTKRSTPGWRDSAVPNRPGVPSVPVKTARPKSVGLKGIDAELAEYTKTGQASPHLTGGETDIQRGAVQKVWDRTTRANEHTAPYDAEIANQARRVPRTASMLKVNYTTDAESADIARQIGRSEATSVYDPRIAQIQFKGSLRQPGQVKATSPYTRQAIDSQFVCKCGPQHVADGNGSAAHEFGHHVHYTMLRGMTTTQKRQLGELLIETNVINDRAAARAVGFGERVSFDTWHTTDMVSEYGAGNQYELFAEIWTEYTTNPDARPHVKRIGQFMEKTAEAAAERAAKTLT
jgi:SPP1 gp7 family putative phage head morphogenesis protein